MGTSHSLSPWSHLHPSKAQKRAVHSWLRSAVLPPQVAGSCLEGMTCDLLSILLSAPPKPGTRQVHGNALAAAVARNQRLFPNQGKENRIGCGLFALLFLPLGSPHRSDTLPACLSPGPSTWEVAGPRVKGMKHRDEKQAGGVRGFNKPRKNLTCLSQTSLQD